MRQTSYILDLPTRPHSLKCNFLVMSIHFQEDDGGSSASSGLAPPATTVQLKFLQGSTGGTKTQWDSIKNIRDYDSFIKQTGTVKVSYHLQGIHEAIG